VTPESPDRDEPIPPPPVLRSWRNVYALVVAELAVLVALFYALTRWAS
jgi:hypothetical protein